MNPLTVANPGARDAAEMAVLGAVVQWGMKALDAVTDEHVRPEHFRYPQHQTLLRGMLALKDAGHAIDALTLKARFDSPQSPISPAEIELLTLYVPDGRNLRDYCRIIKKGAWRDDTQESLYAAYQALEVDDEDAFMAALSRIESVSETETPQTAAEEFMDWFSNDRHAWPLPYSALTEAVGGGLMPGEVTVLGGWSGMGKTFLLSQILRCCVEAGANTHEYANEMHGPMRTARTVASLTGLPVRAIERKQLRPAQFQELFDALKRLPYQTSATAGWRVEDYCRDLRRRKWDVAAIDTVTNLPCSRVDEWDRACVMLADAAAQAGTHLILVSQLNLERDKGKKPPPVGRDLRNTGAWYQRARVVMFIHRDQEAVQAGDGSQIWRATSDGHVRVEKATHGQEAFVPVTFNPRWLTFEELSSYSRPLEVAA